MAQNAEPDRQELFTFHDAQSEFDEAANEIIRRFLEKQRDTVIASENVISYSHGERWMAWQKDDEDKTHEFQKHSHEESITFQDIIDHKISILAEYIHAMAEGVFSQFMTTLYQTLHEATERTGNVVDAKKHGSQAEAFLEMLRKIEFGVDRYGAVSRPQIHLSPEMADKLMKDLEAQGVEFRQKVEELTAAKEAAALEREEKRKAGFVKPAGEQ